jgi:hypothetical protein
MIQTTRPTSSSNQGCQAQIKPFLRIQSGLSVQHRQSSGRRTMRTTPSTCGNRVLDCWDLPPRVQRSSVELAPSIQSILANEPSQQKQARREEPLNLTGWCRRSDSICQNQMSSSFGSPRRASRASPRITSTSQTRTPLLHRHHPQ